MVIVCDSENNYINENEDLNELIELIEEKEMKYHYEPNFNIIKIMTKEQYNMYFRENIIVEEITK